MTATAVTLILVAAGFIFCTTDVLHAYTTTADRLKRNADYEMRYGQNSGIPQPRFDATILRAEISSGNTTETTSVDAY